MLDPTYALTLARRSLEGEDDPGCFVGGHPFLRPTDERPVCAFCHSPMTFLLQVTPPADVSWAGRTTALFECTACTDRTPEEHLSPGPVEWTWQQAAERGVEVAEGFIEGTQQHHRILVNRTADVVRREDVPQEVARRRLVTRRVRDPYFGLKVGGLPSWQDLNQIFEDARYEGEKVTFLFQIPTRRAFRRLLDPQPVYLFEGNPAFAFAVMNRNPPAAFLIPAAEMAANTRQQR